MLSVSYDTDISVDSLSDFAKSSLDVRPLLDSTHCLVFASMHALKLALCTRTVDFGETAVIADGAHALLAGLPWLPCATVCLIFAVLPCDRKEIQPVVVAVTRVFGDGGAGEPHL